MKVRTIFLSLFAISNLAFYSLPGLGAEPNFKEIPKEKSEKVKTESKTSELNKNKSESKKSESEISEEELELLKSEAKPKKLKEKKEEPKYKKIARYSHGERRHMCQHFQGDRRAYKKCLNGG